MSVVAEPEIFCTMIKKKFSKFFFSGVNTNFLFKKYFIIFLKK